MKRVEQQAQFQRDLAMLILILWAMGQALIMTFASPEMRQTYLVVLFAMDVAVLVGYFGRPEACLALCSTVTCVWVTYKLYGVYMNGHVLYLLDYFLSPMPLLGAVGAKMYCLGIQGISNENAMLRQQVEELVLVDNVTGMYNLRALYRDMQVMVHYCDRNQLPLSLMEIQLRYESELRGMLPASSFTELRKQMCEVIHDSIRVEDRVYSVDDKGSVMVLLTTTERDSSVVRSRILNALSTTDKFSQILEAGTKLDVRISCKQYDKDVYGKDMIRFRKAVEAELVYDV
ncbi:MAG: hypothetical protein PUC00_02535 [Clostridiales bacterium]|nr:hypothetical protein [Clostridiales bacterium]